MAGYKSDIEKLFELNQGMTSRFPATAMFEDYTDDELYAMFQKQLTHEYRVQGPKVVEDREKSTARPPPSASAASPSMSSYGYRRDADPLQQVQDAEGHWWRGQDAQHGIGYGSRSSPGLWTDNFGNTTHDHPSKLNELEDYNGLTWTRQGRKWRSHTGKVQSHHPGAPTITKPGTSGLAPRPQAFTCVEKCAWAAIRRLGRQRGVDGFGNARSVRTLFDLACERQAKRLRSDPSQAKKESALLSFVESDLLGPKPQVNTIKQCKAYKQLHNMEGLHEVKAEIDNMIKLAVQNYNRELEGKQLRTINLNRVFLGNPGTGKTTVAKFYADLLKHLGLLTKGDVIYKTASDFKGAVIGESENTTRAILDNAKGCVLVIDEAYSFDTTNELGQGGDMYGKAIIDTLVERVSGSPGEDRAVILLGYEEEMRKMIEGPACNPGLKRRFQLGAAFKFVDYTDEQLVKIMLKKVKAQELQIAPATARRAIKTLASARAQPKFGNAGEIDSLLSSAKVRMEQSRSMILPEDFGIVDGPVLTLEDELAAVIGCRETKESLKNLQRLVEFEKTKGGDFKKRLPYGFLFLGMYI